MAYTRPSASSADFSFAGLAAYTRPAPDAADLTFEDILQGMISAPSVLGSARAVAAITVESSALMPAILGAARALAGTATGWVAVASPLGAVRVTGSYPIIGLCVAASPLGAALAKAFHDFTGLIGDAITYYVMDLTTPGGTVRVPISSWQATLQTGAKCYVQAVVPAVSAWIDAINDATEFIVTRAADTSVGRIEYEMARAPLEQISISKGPTNYTATLSGYSTAFAENEEPDAAYDRTLTGIRSVTTGTSATRVRCAIDWLLRPGQRAYYDDGASFVVSYINYYVPATGDAYMDVGE